MGPFVLKIKNETKEHQKEKSNKNKHRKQPTKTSSTRFVSFLMLDSCCCVIVVVVPFCKLLLGIMLDNSGVRSTALYHAVMIV